MFKSVRDEVAPIGIIHVRDSLSSRSNTQSQTLNTSRLRNSCNEPVYFELLNNVKILIWGQALPIESNEICSNTSTRSICVNLGHPDSLLIALLMLDAFPDPEGSLSRSYTKHLIWFLIAGIIRSVLRKISTLGKHHSSFFEILS